MPLTDNERQQIINQYVDGLRKMYPNGVRFSADLFDILTENMRRRDGLGQDSATRDSIARAIIDQLATPAEPAAV